MKSLEGMRVNRLKSCYEKAREARHKNNFSLFCFKYNISRLKNRVIAVAILLFLHSPLCVLFTEEKNISTKYIRKLVIKKEIILCQEIKSYYDVMS